MTAVTVVESDLGSASTSTFAHGQFGMHLARVLVVASGYTYVTPFQKIKNIQASLETAPTAGYGMIRASESSAGTITFGTDLANVVVALTIWGQY